MPMPQTLERNVRVSLQAVFDGKGFAFAKNLSSKNVGVIKSIMDQITPRYVEIVQIINRPFAAVVKQLVNHVFPEGPLRVMGPGHALFFEMCPRGEDLQ